MLDIVNNTLVAKTAEGCFEINETEAHRALTIHFLELMEDNTPEHLRDNYKEAMRLFDIGSRVYKSNTITATQTREDLLPLVDCLVRDKSDRHLAYVIMRYITREYSYKIRTLHDKEALYDFFYILRDPIYTLVVKDKVEYELFYRVVYAFYKEIGKVEEHAKEYRTNAREDFRYLESDILAFEKAIKNGSELPYIDVKRKYQPLPHAVIQMPYEVVLWGRELKSKGFISEEDYKELDTYKRLFDSAYSRTSSGLCEETLNNEYELGYKKNENGIKDAYKNAKKLGCYNICYYIAQRIGSDFMRADIAKLSGIEKVYDNHISRKRLIKGIIKRLLIALAIYVGYSVIKWIYDFIDMPLIFWFIFFPCFAIFSPEHTDEGAVMFTHSPYRRARYYQAQRQEKLLRDLNDKLDRYNSSMYSTKNGYRHF